jgi:hypothetical protein
MYYGSMANPTDTKQDRDVREINSGSHKSMANPLLALLHNFLSELGTAQWQSHQGRWEAGVSTPRLARRASEAYFFI